MFICVIAALLHDIADEKLNVSKNEGIQKVINWFKTQPLAGEEQKHIIEIISTMSFNGGNNPPMRTIEGKVVQDADRLDAMGAIAIGRTFLFAGWKGHPLHDPNVVTRESMTPEEYRTDKNTAINHFYEKLLKLKDLINTLSTQKIAEKRHQFMELYLDQFIKEWEGED